MIETDATAHLITPNSHNLYLHFSKILIIHPKVTSCQRLLLIHGFQNLHDSAMQNLYSAPLTFQQSMSSLNLMRSLVTSGELTNRMSNWRFGPAEAAQFKALGFQNEATPYLDFDVAHCGMLAFDCVMYFAHNCPKETEEVSCPFVGVKGLGASRPSP